MNDWTDSSNERHVRNYDNEEVWHLDAYDRRSATILDQLGATRIDAGHDGASYDCTPQQVIEYIAALAGLNVEFRSRKKAQLSPEQLAAKRERMRQMNAAKLASLSTMNGM